MPVEVHDRIEKEILLRAPRARVWRALTDHREFGEWFGMRCDAPFKPGQAVTGTIVPTAIDAAVAKAQEPYKGMPFEMTIEQLEPERLFSFRWHPFAIDRNVDYSAEPTTLVTFTLEDDERGGRGTLLKVCESGFDRIPLARRAAAFTANEQGWGMVVTLLEKYVAAKP
jgi:uncharacterized protein YndB with AHSA1/START domain